MVELQKKYKIGSRRFGLFNWIGTYSLFKKEVLRFLTVSGQTLFGPILTPSNPVLGFFLIRSDIF